MALVGSDTLPMKYWRQLEAGEPEGTTHEAGGGLLASHPVHAERIAFWTFCQWCFFRQWLALKAYANGKGIEVIGDAPIFIAYQSAEVWAHPSLFELDASGRPMKVIGASVTSPNLDGFLFEAEPVNQPA